MADTFTRDLKNGKWPLFKTKWLFYYYFWNFVYLINPEFRERSNSGGARTSGFSDFIEDPICTKLCQEYQDGKIPTKQELLKRLLENGKKISMPTLKNYLEEIDQV